VPKLKVAGAAARGLLVLSEAAISAEDFVFELDRIAALVGLEVPAHAMAG
jgi:hypothetical protein